MKKKKSKSALVWVLLGCLLLSVQTAVILQVTRGASFVRIPSEEDSVETIETTVPEASPEPEATAKTEEPTGSDRPRLSSPVLTPSPDIYRNLTRDAFDLSIEERHINQPSVYKNEIFYSAGNGRIENGPVLKKLCLYNLETGEEEIIAETTLYNGSFYETLLNEKWMVWLETDHGKKNRICVKNRETSEVSTLKNCENGKPKLRLSGDILIWMEQTEEDEDRLYMIDLESQENVSLFTFTDVVTYGVSAPDIRNDIITWAGPLPVEDSSESLLIEEGTEVNSVLLEAADSAESIDSDALNEPDTSNEDEEIVPNDGVENIEGKNPEELTQQEATAEKEVDETEVSGIYWVDLKETEDDVVIHVYFPGTYVHEPLFDGENFLWIDTNKSFSNKLYWKGGDDDPVILAERVTSYAMGDGFAVYSMNSGIWITIFSTGETCRLSSEEESGIMPVVEGRTVVWDTTRTDDESRDVIRCRVLNDDDLYPAKATEGVGN